MTKRTIIHNGDHLQFELDHAGVDPRDRPDWPLPSFDAADWAEAFITTANKLVEQGAHPAELLQDKAWLTGWFANALMRGYDEKRGEERRK